MADQDSPTSLAAQWSDLRTECLERAHQCVLRGEVLPARELMEQAQRICPDARVEAMIETLAKVRSPLPAQSLVRLSTARRIAAEGRFEEADEIFRDLLERHPRTPVLLRDLVEIRVRAQNPSGALVAALRWIALVPDSVEALANAAGILMSRGDRKRAIPLLDKILAIDSLHEQARDARKECGREATADPIKELAGRCALRRVDGGARVRR